MISRMLTKEDMDAAREWDGFPKGDDERIIALSRTPEYTACPNPFAKAFVETYGTPYDERTDHYHREPFAADVSEGKNDAIYNVHAYHTKVPYKAIMRYILHYTEPGDIVLDAFCGTGMTGVAANMCGHPEADLKAAIEKEMPRVKWGSRYPILNDLSPIAALIAADYNREVDVEAFAKEAEAILEAVKKDWGWMYRTGAGHIVNTVWSDVLICPNCGGEIVFYDAAADKTTGKIRKTFDCPHCGAALGKRDCRPSLETYDDPALKDPAKIIRQKPVRLICRDGGKKYEKAPDAHDLAILEKIQNIRIEDGYPTDRMRIGTESRRNDKIGLTHVHHYFYKRTLIVLARMWALIQKSRYADILTIWFTSQLINLSKMNRYRPQVTFPYNPLSGTLYVSSLVCEADPFKAYEGKIKKFARALKNNRGNKACVSTGSATDLPLPDACCDYIFTDPPFGANLNYSELSFIWEAWLGVFTNDRSEAIINKAQEKDLTAYQTLMARCFAQYYRVLKPGRWMTVEFHNSSNAVWNAIQEALREAGFIVADVRTLDKQERSFKQVTAASAVQQDLILSAYKPKDGTRKNRPKKAGSAETAWNFTRKRLETLPVTGDGDALAERQAYLLFGRMVADHIMRGMDVALDSAAFYKGLDERFEKRDGMYFLPGQIPVYDGSRKK